MNVEKMFTTIDTHVAGEAFRMIVHSSITLKEDRVELNGALLEKKFVREKELLLNEPRGHRGINGCMVIPSKIADYGLLFITQENEAPFKYSGLVASITALLETGNLPAKENNLYDIETIHGIQTVCATYENQEVHNVRLQSGECRVVETTEDYRAVEIDHLRRYFIFDLPELIPSIKMENLSSIMKWGRQTTEKMGHKRFLFDGMIMMEPISENEVRSVTFEKDGNLLRSPGMDSTFAIFTLLRNGTKLTNQSIFASKLTAHLLDGTNKSYSVETQGFVTGVHQFIYDQEDPLKNGFLLK
ncbi:proline racemase family protein [Halobacillus shinanisalinarum]|uniref:Proline racemase family protein n=1 Tax=Halobacillus shinanisalinarum TaxID=2932258 RepID=A0ABY4H3J5_9BACI|nr:proline racemase family protein [Halobacillus shinanisalinarum]UOQ94776.1 proline racemase family protein [Halobacillus shinanisalinarum]